ncbi:MAG: hypothetical protein KIT31_36200, partial [Deltaproteobacteria bacterium]|nr:hypothetical protein [Deltaproteobacteria bacterium]
MKRPLIAFGIAAAAIAGLLVVWKLRCGGTDGDGAIAGAGGGSGGSGATSGGGRARRLATSAPASISGRIT